MASQASAPDPICGVWQLEQWVEFRDGDPCVLDAGGRLFYHPDGHMSAILTRQTEDGPLVIAYAGRWLRDGSEVHHDVEHATFQRWVGITLTREIVEFAPGRDGRLLLRTPPEKSRSGAEYVQDLIWVRAV
jgi:hypothetical protein